MGGGIDVDAPLDYVAFQISPSQNRYEAFVYGDKIVEKIADGILDQLMLHLSKAKELDTEASSASFRLQQPKKLNGVAWFTKSTTKRFLNIVGVPDLFNITAVEDEMAQLDKAIKFHLSLYAQPEVKNVSSEGSKNELLRAMDLRLRALRGELIAVFNRAAGGACSAENIIDLINFSEHFGAVELKGSLCKVLKLVHDGLITDPVNVNNSSLSYDSRHENMNKIDGDSHNFKSLPIKYGVSPSKVAQAERQSSTESEESSDSDDEDQTSVERSRTLLRSASPRRSASPMRRIQIGRSGSHRAAALTIKSLALFPARERASSQRDTDANSSDEERYEKPLKKTEINVQRMSVQDAISLFERKKEAKVTDILQKSLTDISVAAKKSVLRRWSSGMGESSTQVEPESVCEASAPLTPENIADTEVRNSSGEEKLESSFISGNIDLVEIANDEITMERHEKRVSQPINTLPDTLVTPGEESIRRATTSLKWNQQKEAELNHMMMQMTEKRIVKSSNPVTKKNLVVPSEHRGGFYDHYKEKREEKLRGENAGKRAQKEAKLNEMQQIINERKADMASKNVNNVGKNRPIRKLQKSDKSLSQSQDVNSNREISQPAIVKKVSSRSSIQTAIRKPSPSTPQPRAAVTPPLKTPSRISSAATTPNSRKAQPPLAATRPSPKSERPIQAKKKVKAPKTDISEGIKGLNEKQTRSVTKSAKTTKAKALTVSENDTSMAPTNPTFYSKITRKNSVVPLEPKSLVRKTLRSEVASAMAPTIKTKAASRSEVSSEKSGKVSHSLENETDMNSPVLVNQQNEKNLVDFETDGAALESETMENNYQICSNTHDNDNNDHDHAEGDGCIKKIAEYQLLDQAEEEESSISPHAWVEETSELPTIPHRHDTSQVGSPANVVPEPCSSPRIRRHSLSQMLQEENSEPEIMEWGNAENPPSMIYQKDAPKGLKRLLRFARKSKGDLNITGWTSPSAISDGEDDFDEFKGFGIRNSDKLVRKSTLHAKSNGQRKKLVREVDERNVAAGELISDTIYAARSSANKYNSKDFLTKSQEGQTSAAATTKATRSFFSLSAFRGSNKPNETKLH